MVHNPGGDWNPGWGVDLTARPLKMDRWNTFAFPFGFGKAGLFSGAMSMLVSGSVLNNHLLVG